MTLRERLALSRAERSRIVHYPAYQRRGIMRWIMFGTIGRQP